MISINFYAITALVSAIVCAAILRCNNSIYEKDHVIRTYFSYLLTVFVLCDLIDCTWGLMSTKTLNLGRLGFNIVSYLIHFTIIFAVSCWCIFLTNYFGFRESRTVMILQCIPLVAAVGIIVTQIMNHTVFYIDDDCNYYSGPFRIYLFAIQYSYYVIALAKIIYFLIKHRKEHSLRFRLIVFECAVIPPLFGILQFFNSDAPYSALGLMLSAIIVFNGMMVIEKHRRSHKYETISLEMFSALEALSDSYVSVVLLDLEEGTDSVVKTTPYADSMQTPIMDLREKVIAPFYDSATPEFKEEIKEFADINTLQERMYDRRSLSMQYCSQGIGWCVLSFIAAERDEERNLKKVVLAVQSVDETKKKEQKYEEALSRAYKNENAVFAELIKMESTAVVASADRRVLFANDAALEVFNRVGTDPKGMEVFEFWKNAPIRTTDEIKKKFYEIEANGGSFTYQTVAYEDGHENEMRHLRADVKRVDLLDGSHAMITCFTDVTAGKLLEDKLRLLSETDGLTNMANRRCGESQIRLLLSEGVPGLFCLFDVNGFKSINDTYGHQTGDDTLVAVANAVKASFRNDDIFMRLGGDEFAVYMRNVATIDLAKIRIARLFENIARIELPNIPRGSVTISLGAVIVPSLEGAEEGAYDDIYKRADEQMYSCKGRSGSNMSIEEMKEKALTSEEGLTDEKP